jgi:hypothetical protein
MTAPDESKRWKSLRTATLCAGARRLWLLSVAGFFFSLRPPVAESAAVDCSRAWPSLAPGLRCSTLVHGMTGRCDLALWKGCNHWEHYSLDSSKIGRKGPVTS